MVKIIYLLILLIFFQNNSFAMSEKSFETSELNYTSDHVIVDFAKKMQKKNLYACGISGREDKGKIIDFKVSFQYGRILDIPSARSLIVETVLLFVEEINNNKEVHKYLYHYPFTSNDVIVTILPDFSILSDKECASSVIVKAYLGRINYCVDDGVARPFVDLHQETFEEARKILHQ